MAEEQQTDNYEEIREQLKQEITAELAPTLSNLPVIPSGTTGRKKNVVTTAALLVNDGQASLTPCTVLDSEFIAVGNEKKGTYKEIFYHVNPTLLVIDRELFPGMARRKQHGYYYIVTFFAKQYEPITRNLNTGAALGSIAHQKKKINKLIELGVLIQYKIRESDKHPTIEWIRAFGEEATPPEGKNYRVSPEYTEYEIYDVSDIDAITAEVKHAQDTKLDMHLMSAMNEELDKDKMADIKMLVIIFTILIGCIAFFAFYFMNEIAKSTG